MIRRTDGKREPNPLDSLQDPATLAVALKVIDGRFGSLAGFEKKMMPLLARVFGPYALEVWEGLTDQGAAREFVFTLTLPGEVVEMNGARPELEKGRRCMYCAPARREDRKPAEPELARGTTAKWRFQGLETYPAGYAMEARSLLGDEALQNKLFGKARLNTPDKAKAYADLVTGSTKLLDALKACRKEGRSDPLHLYRKEVSARQDREEVTRVEKLLRLLHSQGQ